MPEPRLLRALAIAGAAAALALVSLAAGASGGTKSPRLAVPTPWHYLASLDHPSHGNRLVTVGWAAGRAWFFVGSQRGLTIASARGRTLTAQATRRVQAPLSWYPIVLGSDVLYSTTRSSTGIAPLLANGNVGPAEAASPEPMETGKGIPVAAARLGGRLVWALAGGVRIGDGLSFRPTLAVCCDEAGAAVDLTSLITPRPAPSDHALGVDDRGRVWLAWLDQLGRRAEARIVELDPTTLERQTVKALVAPVTGPLTLKLACARTCRLVMVASEPRRGGGMKQYLATWAPGERSATRLVLPRDPQGFYEHPELRAVDYRGGRLAVAYTQSSSNYGRTLNVVVGDARGARARLEGSVEVPARFSGTPMWIGTVGAFTPSGLAFAQAYSGGSKVRVAATVVPLR
jgi:hypothetical protein